MSHYEVTRVTNTHLAIVAKNKSMASDFESILGYWSNSPIGSIQVIYDDLFDGTTSTFEIFASNRQEPDTFGPLPFSKFVVNQNCSSRIWNLGYIGYKFFKVVYTAGDATSGTVTEINAVGKSFGFS